MTNQVTVSLTLNEIAETLGSLYRLYNRQKAIAGERRDSGAFEDEQSAERLSDMLHIKITAIESMLSTQCGLLFEHFEETAPVHQYTVVAVSGYNPYCSNHMDGVFTIYSREEDIIAEKRREVERAAATGNGT